MRVGRWLAGAVVWLLAVAVVAGVAWFAIDSAGREVAGADAMTLVSAVQPSRATTPANVAPTPAPSPTTLGAGRPGPGGHAGTPSGTPSVPGWGGGRTGTSSTAGGDVAVRCVGDEVVGWAVRAADGWRSDAAPRAAGHLRVLFVAGDGRTAGVEAACQHGQPEFSPVG